MRLQRYEMVHPAVCGSVTMGEKPTGEWVKHTDVAALETENRALRVLLANVAMLAEFSDEARWLREEVWKEARCRGKSRNPLKQGGEVKP